MVLDLGDARPELCRTGCERGRQLIGRWRWLALQLGSQSRTDLQQTRRGLRDLVVNRRDGLGSLLLDRRCLSLPAATQALHQCHLVLRERLSGAVQ